MTEKSLKQKSLIAMIWSGAEIFSKRGIQFVISIILARLLGPSEYGTIALLYVFIELAGVVTDSGLSSALVQHQNLTIQDESSVFWFQMTTGLIFSAILILVAPEIALFYAKPILEPLLNVLSISFFIAAMGSIHHVLLTKNLDFERPLKVAVFSGITSGCIAIILALKGYGVWALAAQTLVSSIVSTLLFWLLSRWRPKFIFSIKSIKNMLSYSFYIMLSDLLTVTYNRVYALYIGKVYSSRELGIYSRAENTKQIPLDLISRMYSQVAFPVFSKTSDDKEKFLRGSKYAFNTMLFITFPIMIGLMVSAKELIFVLFGEKWIDVAPILEILCLAGIFWPLQMFNINLQKALGSSKCIFKTEVFKKVIGIAFIIFSLPYGIIGIAWSQVAYGFIGFVVNAYFTGRLIQFGFFKQILDVIPVLTVSIIMGVVLVQINNYFIFNPLEGLIIKIIVGALVFSIVSIVFRLRGMSIFMDILSSKYVDKIGL